MSLTQASPTRTLGSTDGNNLASQPAPPVATDGCPKDPVLPQTFPAEFVESDDEAEMTMALERHRSTIHEHDRRRSLQNLLKTRAIEKLQETTLGLSREVELLRNRLSEAAESRAASTAAHHELHLEMIRISSQLEAAQGGNAELSQRLQHVQSENLEFQKMLEVALVSSKRRQNELRHLLLASEERERALLDWSFERSLELSVALCRGCLDNSKVPFAEAPEQHSHLSVLLQRDFSFLSTLERLQRSEIDHFEMQEMQTLLNRFAYLDFLSREPTHLRTGSTPRASQRGQSPSSTGAFYRAKSPSSSANRPWYPPGHASIPEKITPTRRSHSPAASSSSARVPSSSPLPATSQKLKQLLSSLSA